MIMRDTLRLARDILLRVKVPWEHDWPCMWSPSLLLPPFSLFVRHFEMTIIRPLFERTLAS